MKLMDQAQEPVENSPQTASDDPVDPWILKEITFECLNMTQ